MARVSLIECTPSISCKWREERKKKKKRRFISPCILIHNHEQREGERDCNIYQRERERERERLGTLCLCLWVSDARWLAGVSVCLVCFLLSLARSLPQATRNISSRTVHPAFEENSYTCVIWLDEWNHLLKYHTCHSLSPNLAFPLSPLPLLMLCALLALLLLPGKCEGQNQQLTRQNRDAQTHCIHPSHLGHPWWLQSTCIASEKTQPSPCGQSLGTFFLHPHPLPPPSSWLCIDPMSSLLDQSSIQAKISSHSYSQGGGGEKVSLQFNIRVEEEQTSIGSVCK